MRRSQNTGRAVRLATFDNEPAARLAEQRLRGQGIPSVVRSLGVGPGLWGTAFNMPQALEVLESDALRAAEVLGLPPAELAERARYDGDTLPGRRSNLGLVLMAIAVAVVLVVAASALSQAFQ